LQQVETAGHKVPAVVDYRDFRVLPDLEDAYWRMVEDVADRCHSSTTRYVTQAFLRARLGAVLLPGHSQVFLQLDGNSLGNDAQCIDLSISKGCAWSMADTAQRPK